MHRLLRMSLLVALLAVPAGGGGARDAVDGVDAADRYGIWKLSEALFACAFEGMWCDHALGNTPEQRFMGTWSDGVPVAELTVVEDAAASGT